jgi:hypothetical protein
VEYVWMEERREWVCHGVDHRIKGGYSVVCGWGDTMEEAFLHWAERQSKAYINLGTKIRLEDNE